jgi:hypothetical protein
MPGTLQRCCRRAFRVAAVALLPVMLFSCAHAPSPGRDCTPGSPPVATMQLNACLKDIVFDKYPAAGDMQPLMVLDPQSNAPCPPPTRDTMYHEDERARQAPPTHGCRYGPIARIEPVDKAHKFSDGDLKNGRIIARLFLTEGQTEPYEKLSLFPGDTTYWFVIKATRDSGTSYYVAKGGKDASTRLAMKSRPVHFHYHNHGDHKPLARWVWDPHDETSWGRCGDACCK